MSELPTELALTRARLLNLLRHALGYGHPRAQPGWRNYFCAEVGSEADLDWQVLSANGYAHEGATINQGADRYYHATERGKQVAATGEFPEPGIEVRNG